MKNGRALLLVFVGFVAGLASAPSVAHAVDSSITGPLERTARAAERIASTLESLSRR